MLIENSVHICIHCNREFERFIPHSHEKPCKFGQWIAKYYKFTTISDILDALDEEFIYSVNNGIVKCGGEEGWEEYEKLIKKYIQKNIIDFL